MSFRLSGAPAAAFVAISGVAALVVLSARPADANRAEAAAVASKRAKIAFVRGYEIYVVRGDGHDVRKVAASISSTPVLNPGWSSDRKRLAFMEFIKESANEIGTVQANGKNRVEDAFELSWNGFPIVDEPAWSPDDKRIAFVAYAPGPELTAAIVIASTIHPTNTRPKYLTDFRHHDIAPTWSPSGRQLCFERNAKPGRDFYEIGIAKNSTLFVIATSGGRPLRITDGGEPDWSPDSKMITFAQQGDIYVVRPNGSGRRLLIGGKTTDGEPRWSPDGTKVAFVRARNASCSSVTCVHDLWVADRDGRNQRLVVRNAQLIDW